MKYEELKEKIEGDIEKLAKKIEDFCVIDNTEYATQYKKDLVRLHDLLEEILHN